MRRLQRYARPVGLGLVIAGLLFGAYLFLVIAPASQTFGYDAFAYWSVTMPEPYAVPVGALGSFNYSPAYALIADWFSAVEWWVFLWLWSMLLVGTVVWMAGSPGWVLVAFALPFVALELYHGNIHILLAAAIVLGFKHPWTWAFVLLSKPSAGIGLLWFVARGEWRALAIALGTTAFISALSFLIAPSLWFGWADLLAGSIGQTPLSPHIAIPLWLRLPAAALLVIWGARTGRRWTVVVSSMLALPVLWFAAPAMLVGVIPDLRRYLRERQAAKVEANVTGEASSG
jgi:hypothetical protein